MDWDQFLQWEPTYLCSKKKEGMDVEIGTCSWWLEYKYIKQKKRAAEARQELYRSESISTMENWKLLTSIST
jgi:hypothetical protein